MICGSGTPSWRFILVNELVNKKLERTIKHNGVNKLENKNKDVIKLSTKFINFKPTLVNTPEAVDQDKQGTKIAGWGQLVAANEAICKNNIEKCTIVYTKHIYEKKMPLFKV